MGNIIPVGTKGRNDVKVWLDKVNRSETLIYVAIAIDTKDGKTAGQIAEEIRNHEMLVLRHAGFEMPEGFKPEVTKQQIEDMDFQVTMYRFVMAEWKRKTMKGWFEKT